MAEPGRSRESAIVRNMQKNEKIERGVLRWMRYDLNFS